MYFRGYYLYCIYCNRGDELCNTNFDSYNIYVRITDCIVLSIIFISSNKDKHLDIKLVAYFSYCIQIFNFL